jgi:excinuclease UvrABC nuclease subunit
MSQEAERGLAVAEGILKLIAERDMAQRCERSADEAYAEQSARLNKQIEDHRKQSDEEFHRAERLEDAMLALVDVIEAQFTERSDELNSAVLRCREESGMGDKEAHGIPPDDVD